MKKIFFFVVISAVFLSGCMGGQGPEELERLVKEDPVFKNMIVQRNRAHSQIALIKEDLLKKKKLIDAQVEKLRGEYDLYAKGQNRKIEQCRAAIEANRGRLKNEIASTETQVESKQAELEGYQKTLADVQKVLKDPKGITISAQEKKRWGEHVMMLTEKIRPLAEDIQELKLQTRLKKQKISYLD